MTTAVTVDQLRNLTNRAGHGLTPDEQQRFRDGIDQLYAELEHARAEADRYAEAESADAAAGSYAGRVEELEAALARQTQETATWRATANALDTGGPGTPRARAEQAEAANDRIRRLAARIRQGVPWAANFDNLADHLLAALDGEQQADVGPEPEDLTGAYTPDPPIGCLTPAEEARLAQDGIDTPGCDCGHDGMGVSWHSDDCRWRRSVVDCPGRPTPD